MKKTVILGKINMLGVFLRTALPLVITGFLIGILMGLYVTRGDAFGVTRWVVMLKTGLVVGSQGLALSVLITVLTGIYNIIINLTGGIRLTDGDRDKR